MVRRKAKDPDWMKAFLAALSETKVVVRAVEAAGITTNAAYHQRRTKRHIAQAWQAALASKPPAETAPVEVGAAEAEAAAPVWGWKSAFFEALAETSNVSASAIHANVPIKTVYKLRRSDAEFAGKWRGALLEGYDHLEMELLGHLRDPSPERKMDVAAACRLLAAHRATVERERALREEDDEEAVRASIDAFLEGMRQRRLANEAILIEAEPDDVAG